MDVTILFFWVTFVILIGVWANAWGRNPYIWAAVAALFSPLLAAIIILIAGKSVEKKAEEAKQIRELSK